MNASPCHALDDYLSHELTGDELVQFVAHLTDCTDCRCAVQEQQHLDTLLGEASERLDVVPAGLTARVERRMQSRKRRRLVTVAAALTATAAAIAVLLHFVPGPDAPDSRPGPPVVKIKPVRPGPPPPETPPPASLVRVRFPDDADLIVVPEKMEIPNVTFIWVHTGLRRPSAAPAVVDPSSPVERNNP